MNYGLASVHLKRLFEKGELPSVQQLVADSTHSGVYADVGGHASHQLKELSAWMWLKVLYDVGFDAEGVESGHVKTTSQKMAEDLISEQCRRGQYPK